MLERFPPGSLVELNDLVMKGRKLCLVDDTGVGYFDIHGDGELPKPLHSELNPQGIGSIAEWAVSVDASQADGFVAAWETLSNRGLDLLTIARAMRWGVLNASFDDPDTLERMGRAATETVLAGRQLVCQAAGG